MPRRELWVSKSKIVNRGNENFDDNRQNHQIGHEKKQNKNEFTNEIDCQQNRKKQLGWFGHILRMK